MKPLMFRIALVALVACMAAPSFAQDKENAKQEKENIKSHDLKYRYAYRRIEPNGSETDIINWDGSVNWDNHAERDELWIGKDDKTYLITDKAVLDAFEAAFGPLRDFNMQRGKYMDGYYQARGQQRGFDHQTRDLDRQISSLQRRRDRTSDASEQKDIDDQLQDLNKQKDQASKQSQDWSKKLDAETKKREEFFTKREDVRAKVYVQIDRIVDGAFAKGLATPGTPD